MDKIDHLIAEALAEEDRRTGGQSVEPAFIMQAFGLFKGRNAWIWWVTTLAQTVMFVGGAWLAWRFFHVTDVVMALRYGLSATVLLLAATALKLSLMPVIEANRVIREIRRVEVARLAAQSKAESHGKPV